MLPRTQELDRNGRTRKGKQVISVRIGAKTGKMRFGQSATQELPGWFDPKKYPIRNANSNAGLRFLGY
jgi:hypothetical protein